MKRLKLLCYSFLSQYAYSNGGSSKQVEVDTCKSLNICYNSDIEHHNYNGAFMKRFGFTLAEVLITLGIIGVVAALTIPSLIINHQKKVTAVRAKKAFVELLQVIKLSEIENDYIENWDKGKTESIANTKRYVEEYIMPYYKSLTLCSQGLQYTCGHPVSRNGVNYLTPNGTSLSFTVTPQEVYLLIDINNKKKPNLIGTDTFYYVIDSSQKLRPYGWQEGITREAILRGVQTVHGYATCKKMRNPQNPNELYRHGCSALLMIDNWEFKKDYPF